MSTALRFADPVSLPSTRWVALTRRLATVPSLHVGAAALSVLVGGLLLAIATTSDPLWWQLHFSQLGIFGDLSSAFFNTTLKVSGIIVVFFAFCVRRDVRRLGRGPVRRGAATVAFLCLNVVGVNLALVGCIPLNTDKDLHDRVAGSMVLGFLALLLSAPLMFNRLGKRMAIGTGIATVWLVISIALFVSATINLALFETIACGAMFAWSGMFTQVLASAAARTTAAAAAVPARHVVPRRARRPLAARRLVATPATGSRPAPAHLVAAASPTRPRRAAASVLLDHGLALTRLHRPTASVPRDDGLAPARPHRGTAPVPLDLAAARGTSTAARSRTATPVGTAALRAAADRARTEHPARPVATASPQRDEVSTVASAAHAAGSVPRRPRMMRSGATSASRPVSAPRAARVGSTGDRARRSARPVPSLARPVVRGAARSLLR